MEAPGPRAGSSRSKARMQGRKTEPRPCEVAANRPDRRFGQSPASADRRFSSPSAFRRGFYGCAGLGCWRFRFPSPPIRCHAKSPDYRGVTRKLLAYDDEPYATEDADLTPDDVDALINEHANRRRVQIERAHALRSMTEQLDAGARRKRIPQAIKVAVWQRDGGRWVECESNKQLEFDHVIPLAKGGSNTERNLQLLCADCNRRKGATLG